MGTDIHTIVEIRKNGNWEYITDIPDVFNSRSYGVFSILNSCLRHNYGFDGFEPKGLPKDVSIRKCRFVSQRNELENAFSRSDFVCFIENENKSINVFDDCLTAEIDFEFYEELKSGMTEEQAKRYYYPRQTSNTQGYFVQDAKKVNGQFMNMPFKALYNTIDDFNKVYCCYKWIEEEKDYGYYSVEFDHPDFHGHSYLNLTELKSKQLHIDGEETYQVDKRFYEKLLLELDELPESFIVKNKDKTLVEIIWTPDEYTSNVYAMYEEGIKEIELLKEKYNVKNDEDIRIVFAFDS